MKNLTFNVSTPQNLPISTLLKELNNISCNIRVDVKGNVVSVENAGKQFLDAIVDFVEKYFQIESISINNLLEKDKSEQNVSELKSADTVKEFTINHDDVFVENLINKLLRTISNDNISQKDINEILTTIINEVENSSKFYNEGIIHFSVGDIVLCNYGSRLFGGITGTIPSLVCNSSIKGMVYLLPITKFRPKTATVPYLKLNVPEDIFAYPEDLLNKNLILDKGLYLRPQRLLKVIGKAKPEFLEKVFNQMPETFDFNSLRSEIVLDTKSIFEVESSEEINSEDTIQNENKVIEEPVDNLVEVNSNESEVAKNRENALLSEIGTALENLDKSKSPEEQIVSFLTEINMPTNQLVKQSFLLAFNVEKISFKSITSELCKLNSELSLNSIKKTLRKTFNSWLKQYPAIEENYPQISIISLIKLFAKRFC